MHQTINMAFAFLFMLSMLFLVWIFHRFGETLERKQKEKAEGDNANGQADELNPPHKPVNRIKQYRRF